jgi:nucleoside-diphosphate-sugar epimerase
MVLGGGGAIGSAVLRRAAERGMEVHAVLRAGTSDERLDPCRGRVASHRIDLSDAEALGLLVRRVQPSVMVAAAFPPGHATVDAVRRAHGSQMLANLFALFEAIRARTGEVRLVLVGSAAAYGHGGAPCDPGQALRPQSFRGALKAAESLLTRQLAEEAGIPFVELRVFTAYGPYEQRERLLPQLMRAALLGERVAILREPRHRDWVHFEDVADACLAAAASHAADSAVFNVCSGRLHSLREAAEAVERIVGRTLVAEHSYSGRDQYGDAEPGLLADAERFDWKPRVAFEAGLVSYWAWARSEAGRGYLTQARSRT